MTERCQPRNNIDAAKFRIINEFRQFLRGITIVLSNVKRFGADSPFQIQKQRVVVVFRNEINESFQKRSGFHLPRQIHLDCADLIILIHT